LRFEQIHKGGSYLVHLTWVLTAQYPAGQTRAKGTGPVEVGVHATAHVYFAPCDTGLVPVALVWATPPNSCQVILGTKTQVYTGSVDSPLAEPD